MKPKLSILIPSLVSRHAYLQDLLGMIYGQQPPRFLGKIEVLVSIDNAHKTIGQKRNELLSAANGEYAVFIDDDDHINPDYLEEIFTGIEKNVDHIGIAMVYAPDNGPASPMYCSKDNRWEYRNGIHYRPVQHLCAIKTEIARKVSYPDTSFGEDKVYSDMVTPLVETEHCITKPIYIYKYRSNK